MSHRNPFRKAISVLLALALVLSLAPVRTMAAGQEGPVCGCESDDPSWHAPFCEAYVAPEDPQCLCVEQCAEGAANEWCEVCYFDPAACAASGEEEAAVYATAPNYIASIGIAQDGDSGNTGINDCKNELSGHTIIDRDLNDGAGGDYVYMGYKTTTDPTKAITGIVFRVGGSPPDSITYNGYTFYLVGGSTEANTASLGGYIDLNAKAGGDYVYMYVTKDPSYGAPLIDMTVDGSSSKSGYSTGTNTSGSVIDLNQKAGGDYIYLHYKQFSETVSATYHYLNASGSRTSSTQSGTVKTHLEKMTKVPSYANSVTYDGRTFKFLGWRDDNTAGAAEETSPFATYMTGTKTYQAVYQGNVTVSFDANGGTGAPSAVTGTQYINAGTSSVSKGNVSVTIPSGSCTHPTKCNLLGWAAEKTATSAAYQPGGSITVSGNTTLYAVYGNHSYNDKGICTACSGLDHTCQYNANGFCTRCDGYQPAVLGSGYYQITNGGNLFWFAKHINTVDRTANAKLTADINLEGRLWTPIGFTGETNHNFRGHFDGQGHTITGLNVEGGRSGLGFFGEVRLGTVENFTIYGEVKLIGKYDYVGGVIGSAPGVNENKPDHNGATIRNITSYVNVTLGAGSHGSNRVGGFIGYANHETLIENCAWYGTLDLDIYRAQDGVGGLLGKANDNSTVTIRNCGAYGTIRTAYKSGSYDNFDTIFIGGIVSNSVASAKTTIKNTLWAGKIVNETDLGTKAHIAAFGTLNGIDSVTDCYALDNAPYLTTNGTHDSYITSVTTEQLASGEVAYKLGAAWGQTIGSNAYPILGGQKVYCGYADCQATVKTYANAPLAENVGAHSYDEKGFCTMCGGFQPATGDGTQDNPYKIGNAGQLYWFAAVVNAGHGDVVQNAAAWAELTANIIVNADVLKEDGTLNGDGSGFLPWTPIGNSNSRYTGTFNGNGKTVSGLCVNATTSNVGLFGYLMGTVKNVGVVDSYLSGSNSNVGGVVGKNDEGTITGCYNKGTVSSIFCAGGVVGNNSGTVEDCYNTGTVSGYRYVGGVVGQNGGTVEDCYNTGTVSGSNNYVGGVVGFNNSPCIVANCYNAGTVNGSDYIGGVVGFNNSSCIVANCYNAGTVSGSDYIGGVAGLNDGTVANCYYDSDIYGGTATDVWGKPTAEFASGAVTYSLSQGCTVGEGEAAVTYTGDVWGQNIDGTGDKDAYPVFSDAKIYQAKNCKGEISGYSNTDGKQLDHTYNDNGFCTVCDGFQSATGSGTKSNPYQIGNAGQLYWFAAKVNGGDTDAWAVLAADIVVNENVLKADGTLNGDGSNFLPWTPISRDYFSKYTGTFDGNDKTVSGLYVNKNTDYVSLFGWSEGTVKNVGVVDSYLSGNYYVGGVVGDNYGTVTNCYNTGNVSGGAYVGGVVGSNYDGTVEYCYNTGTVSGSVFGSDDVISVNIGGVVGFNSGSMEDCYNTGAVSGIDRVGGVVGSSEDPVANCYNTGNVSGDSAFVGGVAGSNYGPVVNCYYDSTVYSGNAIGFAYPTSTNNVEGKTAEQFKSGEVAYLLQGEQTQQVWGQNIDGTGDKDAYPVFSDAKVYPAKNCDGSDGAYSNTQDVQKDHIYSENGFCTFCEGFQPATGDGTESDPYQIGNAGQLYWFAKQVNSGNKAINGKLTANIAVNENVLKEDGTLSDDSGDFRAWTPIGKDANNKYTGTFDGNGKTVSGLYFDGNTDYVGLFGWSQGTVKNVGVVDSYFCSSFTNGKVGGVVGYNNIGTVENCYNAGAVKSSGTLGRVGGVVGSDSIGTIKNCYNTGAVSGEGSNNYVGGVVGYIGQSTVENCYNTGAVRKPGVLGKVGGVVGYVSDSGTIKNCYNRGAVISTSLGTVAGGVLGNTEAQTVTVENCYYDSTVYNGDAIGGTFGGTATNVEGKTTEQFKSGEVAFLLQGEQTQQVWGQNIDGEGEKDTYPAFSDAKVYAAKNCANEIAGYSNTDGKQLDHTYNNNGFCSLCGGYEPAVLKNDCYEISNAGQLYWFAMQVNDGQSSINGKLTANITVNENVLNADGTLNGDGSNFNPWTPIGSHHNEYTGTFDGDNHILSGLYCNDTRSSFLGLFGSIGDGNVKNVHVMNSYFGGTEYVGGIAGYSGAGTITNCYNSGTVSGTNCVGGVIGYSYGAVLTGCHSEGTISGNTNVGGVVGYNNYGSTVTDCSNTATINGKYNVGGVVGYGEESSAENCYNTGAVNGESYVGGVAGRNESGPIMCCYNTGTVNSNDYVGGVVGFNDYAGDVTNCYNTGAVSGESYVGGVAGFNFTNITNCYYDSTVYSEVAIGSNRGAATNVEGKTSEEFASGHVAYLLSQGCTVGETVYSGDAWGQKLTGDDKDAYPVLSDAKVYQVLNCKLEVLGYSNSKQEGTPDHTYENGFCTVCDGFQSATGSGIESDPYKIGNAGQLYWFAAEVNDGNTDAWAVLTANITVNTGDVAGCNGTKAEGWKDWTPIGKDIDTQYAGTFDGKGFTVSGLYFNNSDVSYVGLFGFSDGTIKNIGVVNSYLHGFDYVGGVVGENDGTVESCYNTGTVSGTGDHMIGGVVGKNSGTVEGCYNAGPVSGTGTGTKTGIGGVTGYNYGTVEGCYNAGPVSGSSKVGGVVGFNVKGTMVGCYNIGTVSGRYAVGGVVGDNAGGDRKGVVTNCYNTGAVSASGESVGGVAGSNGGDISCCYNTGTVSGSSKVGGVVGYNGAGFTVINSYNNSDAFSGESIGLNDGTAVDVLNKTGAQFASGEVTYLLQREQTEQVWGQNVDGEGEKDPYPIFSEVEVYPVSCCPGKFGGYSNTEGKQQAPKYNENGFCIYCGGFQPATGSGNESDPYKIGNAGQLYWFAAVVNGRDPDAWAVLTANITVNEAVLKADGSLNDGTFQAWTPISGHEERYFGTFDGNGFAVSGLYFQDTTAQYVGLFGFLEGDAVVRNVGVVDSYISGGICVGAVAGVNMGTVEGCYNTGTVIVGESNVGGIVGQNGFFLTNCYNTGAVSGNGAVGGVAGQNGGFLTNCYSAGPVSGSVERIGGVTGFNVGSVTNCYYDSTVYSGEAFGDSYGTATKVEGKSTAEFASGAVTYSLSQGCTVGETTYSGDVWGQNIDSDDKDAYPLFSDAKVYFGYYDCLGSYTNNASVSQVKPGHSGQLTYADNGDDATHTVTCDTCGDVVDASQIHSYGDDHKCLCGAVEEVLSVTISWGSMVFVYTEEAGWNNPDSAWVKTENTGNLQISVTYTYETDRTDIAGIFSNGTNAAAGTAVILPEQTYQVWLRLEGKPGEVLDNAVIGTVKVTVG